MNSDNRLTLLLYHGVTSEKSIGIENVSKKHLDVQSFEDQMRILKKRYACLSMDEVYDVYTGRTTFPKNAVAVTFDDGFRNNYTTAAPILEKYEIPAVFYLCSGVINTNLMFWVDAIEDTINFTQSKRITVGLDKDMTFDLSTLRTKLQALEQIKGHCKNVTVDEKNRIVQQLIQSTHIEPSVEHSKNYEKLSWKEVQELDRHPLFTIGAHSLYHDILAKIVGRKRQQADIRLSLELLEYHLGHPIHHFSYPEGQSTHYDDDIISYLKTLSVKICPSAIEGVNDGATDLFHLRRIMVGFQGKPFPFSA